MNGLHARMKSAFGTEAFWQRLALTRNMLRESP
jgi:hypothetical protein